MSYFSEQDSLAEFRMLLDFQADPDRANDIFLFHFEAQPIHMFDVILAHIGHNSGITENTTSNNIAFKSVACFPFNPLFESTSAFLPGLCCAAIRQVTFPTFGKRFHSRNRLVQRSWPAHHLPQCGTNYTPRTNMAGSNMPKGITGAPSVTSL